MKQLREDLVPWPWTSKDAEDAPAGPDSELTAEDALLQPPVRLTEELLDWVIASLTAVLATPEAKEFRLQRRFAVLREALKYADHLYPLTLEGSLDHAHATRDRVAQDRGERAKLDDSTRDDHRDLRYLAD